MFCDACGAPIDLFGEAAHRCNVGFRDPLTGAANLALLEEISTRILGLARRFGRWAGVIEVRLTSSHAPDNGEHDAVLHRLARRMRRQLRETDVVARMGRDTFAVMLSDLWEPEACAMVASRLLRELSVVRAPGGPGGRSAFADVRVSAAVFPEDGDDLDALLAAAAEAGRRPVPDGPPRVAFHDQAWGEELMAGLDLADDLSQSPLRSQLFLAYQPIFELDGNRLVGAEALSRWRHPSRGTLTAAAFIPQAERTGRIRTIDRWALDTALCQAHAWRDGGWDGWVSVNVSARTFATPRLVPRVLESLERQRLDPDALVIEVTESETLGHLPSATAAVRQLRANGIRVAIDDFGSGYASFRYVSELDASLIKLDRSFLLAAEKETRHARMLESMIQMAHHLDTPVISEGVETEDQRDRLAAAHCDFMQGWLAGDPIPSDAFEERWLA